MKKLIWGIMIVFLFCFPVSAEAQTYSFSASKVVIKTGSKKEIPVYNRFNCGALIQYDGWKVAPDYPW